jgi:arginyl-tRNA synthetase
MFRQTQPGQCISAMRAMRFLVMRWQQLCLGHSGYDVTKEYYINDAGAQVNVLAESVQCCAIARHWAKISARYLLACIRVNILIDVASEAEEHLHGDALLKDKDALAKIKKFAIAEMMVMIKNDLASH